jgi:indole-3-glycerol phosphate synthase
VSGVLASIVASKLREVEELERTPCHRRVPEGPRRSVDGALRRAAGQPLRLIAENKRKSPSAGALSSALTAGERAVRYAESGAAMVSILCDAPFFGGSWDDLAQARMALDEAGHATPLLAKEFVVHERQLHEANACGADAVLLIARLLDGDTLRALHAKAASLGLASLVEVVTEEELAWAVAAGATILGVNARDLDTLEMNAERAARVLAAIPEGAIPLYLSGLKTPADVRRVAATRAHGALVGETLMREDDPRARLRELVQAADPSQT